MKGWIYLTEEDVENINKQIIEKFTPEEMIGIKSYQDLASAVARPQQTIFGEEAYPTIFSKAVALFESIAKNHAFQNANKRTAFISMVIFLDWNGYSLEMDEKIAEDFTVDCVLHKYAFDEMCMIIKKFSVFKLNKN